MFHRRHPLSWTPRTGLKKRQWLSDGLLTYLLKMYYWTMAVWKYRITTAVDVSNDPETKIMGAWYKSIKRIVVHWDALSGNYDKDASVDGDDGRGRAFTWSHERPTARTRRLVDGIMVETKQAGIPKTLACSSSFLRTSSYHVTIMNRISLCISQSGLLSSLRF